MRTKSFGIRYIAALVFLIVTASAPVLEANAQELPPNPRRLIQTSIENWNEAYGAQVKAVNWSYDGTISNLFPSFSVFAFVVA